jgi:CubicO group peptidase (beta-lactamase class C family)
MVDFKIIKIHKKYKFIEYRNNILYVGNDSDNEELNQYSEFMLGSVTKIFTIFILIMLNQKNILNIHDKVNKYIPSNKRNNFSNITIMEIMNHEAGFINLPQNIIQKKYKSATDAMESFINEKILFEKNGFQYSNIGYIILGAII